ncbi:MAG: DUF229 domain-containing protein [Planctomycetota bacterium]|nr:MAG: DUF229 domain-containing protein [Planctomycetota bacterium]
MYEEKAHCRASQRTASAVVLLLGCFAIAFGAHAAAPPSVLLIITDEHNFRTLGCYRELLPPQQAEMWGPGAVVDTPHLDSLARDGVLCARAYATSPVCSPCRAAMMTGRYPHMVGVPANDRVLDRSIPTLADRLNRRGYLTAYMGKWHLGGPGKPEWAPQVDGGFQFKKYMFNRGHWKKLVEENGQPRVGAQRNGKPTYDLDGADETTYTTDFLTDRACEFIRRTAEDQPFCLVLSYPDPHGPNKVRPPYDHMFDGLRFLPPRTYGTGLPQPRWLGQAANHPVFRGSDMSQYFGMVKCLDDNIGELLDCLLATGRLDNTIVIMTSDHGDLCYEHDRLNKGNPYEGSARVPLLVRFPERLPASCVYTEPVGTIDITPTIMGLLGESPEAEDLGRNLADALAEAPLVGSEQTLADRNDSDEEPEPEAIVLRNAGTKASWLAVIDNRYKLVVSVSDDPWLFDNREDPDELLNYYRRPGTDGVAERLARRLVEYAGESQDPYLNHPKIAASIQRILQSD